MHNFKELKVWQESKELVKFIYKSVETFPEYEKYGLSSQISRCSVSIPSNIAEGAGRDSIKEFYRFLGIAHGSSYELETQLIIAYEVGFIEEKEINLLLNKLTSIQKMIFNLKKSLNVKK